VRPRPSPSVKIDGAELSFVASKVIEQMREALTGAPSLKSVKFSGLPARRGHSTLPLNPPGIGTPRWQLAIERYTNIPSLRKGQVIAANALTRP
jgi:hypothetical protein